MSLDKRPATHRRNLIFTSAGNHAALHRWLSGRQSFDLWVTHYGDRAGSYQDAADYYNERKGSKFQNLHFAYQQWPELFARYDYVFAMDDDIIIEGGDIERLFELARKLQLWVCQPAFSPRGRISWPITTVRPTCRYRFTNFVEMTCPLFDQTKLATFMGVYDPVLVGYGMDFWFLHTMGAELSGRVAVIDEIVCINPHERVKGGIREIDRLQPKPQRLAVWEAIKERYTIRGEQHGTFEYGRVRKPLGRGVWDSLKYSTYAVPLWCRRMAVGIPKWLFWRLKAAYRS
jgi:Protein of unknown function (DUF707)